MKKIVVLVFLVCVLAGFAFAQNYTVQSVTGRVERDSGNQRVTVNPGETLNGETIIHTGIGASVVLKDEGGKTFTVAAAQNGKIADLAKAAAGVRIGGNVSRTDTDAVGRTTAQVGTASARASDQAAEEEIANE